ncbi:cytokine-inducible SH2-containing protein-like [Schistocerca americana]|uniref:cytokine-inducible SH2-containing protein-like n=1 Tax=Schistocerca americana TaxID=7009 RepID=UPI001F502EB3|nr:cytokine-inducible SH2-containing protein-like [Schistocerca americana]XP_047120598.1 cytokine-inducible SH2-containing protein-like [Schistocerca piceifrons]XP_049939777.1 cytokine-inducible SH2-containing protein-like isoform X2 [Schistocerca serialis cubense]
MSACAFTCRFVPPRSFLDCSPLGTSEVVRPRWNGAMLTSCPNCQQLLELPPAPLCQHQQSRALAAMAGGGLVSVAPPAVFLQPAPAAPPPAAAAASKDSSSSPSCSPQPSPSVPLTFAWTPLPWAPPIPVVVAAAAPVLPPAPAPPAATALPAAPRPSTVQQPSSDVDLVRLAATQAALRASGWYYEGLSWQQSAELLRASEPGTFLVRDSSDARFLFSLSVQTERGPTSVRLHYVAGQFRLDSEARLTASMPLFNCVVALVEHYVAETQRRASSQHRDCAAGGKEQVWVDAHGQMYSPIVLTRPLYRQGHPPSLQHCARLAVNRVLNGRRPTHLPLPLTLKEYLSEYPYKH